jgi:predicted phosphoadenosine phosphosulfate sulfurtransferase
MALTKGFSDKSCLELARERNKYIFDNYDEVVVSFSGGKDSTVLLNLALDEAIARGKILEVYFIDEEAIPIDTHDYVKRIAKHPSINLTWFCLPFKHLNACSKTEPYWYCYDPKKKELWCNTPPDYAVFEHPLFRPGEDYINFFQKVQKKKTKQGIKHIYLIGIRTEESMRRLASVTTRKHYNYISNVEGVNGYPIYDWTSNDVWLYVNKFDKDYNRLYDKLAFYYGTNYNKARACQPFGQEPLRGIDFFAQAYPELWEKMLYRVDGVNSANLYANTSLYGSRMEDKDGITKLIASIPGKSIKEKVEAFLANIEDPKQKTLYTKKYNTIKNRHNNKSILKLTEDNPDVLSGYCYSNILELFIRGDEKNRKMRIIEIKAQDIRNKLNLTLLEALDKYGVPKFRDAYKEKIKNRGY